MQLIPVSVVRVPTPLNFNPQAPDLAEQLAALAPGSGIYVLQSIGKPPHVGWSVNLRKRLLRLLVSSYTVTPDFTPNGGVTKGVIANLRHNLEAVECWPTGSKLETSLVLYQLTRAYFPTDYLFRLRLRMPWFVGLIEADAFPRLNVVNRIPRKSTSLFGPFASRDLAQHYHDEVLGLFQIRRCTDVLAPTPEHPGCIYGEMNQCLRPCRCVVTAEEYRTEVRRVADFLATNGKSPIAALSGARERAVEQTDFEQAAQIHKRIEKMNTAAGVRDGIVTDVHQFNGVALTRAVEPRHFRLWPMLHGYWQDPVSLDFSAEDAPRQSLDHELRERLNQALANPQTTGKRLDHLALFSRWYYSSWRDGQWFPFRTLADLNYRRLVREISNLAKSNAGITRGRR